MNARKIAIALLAIGALLAPVAQASAAPAPAWSLSASALPGNLLPGAEGTGAHGPEYLLVATNVGGAPTSAPISIVATLPADLSVVQVQVPGGAGNDPEAPKPTCTAATQTVTCTTLGPVHPGRNLQVLVVVDVSPSASGTELLEASVSGGGAPTATANVSAPVSLTAPSFGFLAGDAGLTAPLTDDDGAATVQAGSHPYQQTVHVGFPVRSAGGFLDNAGHPRNLFADLPRGTIVNPTATPVLCSEAQLIGGDCPLASQLGVVAIETLPAGGALPISSPLFNMVPPPGNPALLAFNAAGLGIFVHIAGAVRSDGDFGISALSEDVPALAGHPVAGVRVQLWGDPSGESHDQIRGDCFSLGGSCPVAEQPTALLTMPSQCGGPITTRASVDSWEEPGLFHETSYDSAELDGSPVGVEGCNQLGFEPTIEAKPTTTLVETPTGLDVSLHQPQETSLKGLSTAAVKDITLALPEGMTLNPSAANGIEACSSDQIGLLTPIGQSPIHISKDPNECPSASRLGTLEVTTPALAQYDEENKLEIDPETEEPVLDPLGGSVYLATPFDNPFGSLLAIYLVLEDQKTGIVAKVPAKISADPNTGRLVTKIVENPQVPLEDVEVHLFGGSRAPLISPPLCGTHTTTTTLKPWSSPEGADAHPSDSFILSGSPNDRCPTAASGAVNDPAFSAGTIDPAAGSYSPFVMKLTREDATQRFRGIDATLPPGLIGKLAGLTLCSEAQIAAAKARETPQQGALELANPSCPPSSEVGEVDVSAGAGPNPLFVKAHAYIAGPYKGAPLSLLIVTPAVAGPYDLGAVSVRVALDLDPKSAQIHASSDPLPTILEGIPLDVRGASLRLGRPDFTLNPTNCEPMEIAGSLFTVPGQSALLRSPFQVGGCASLGFGPKLDLRLKGGTKRGGHPAFEATYRPKPGDANLKGMVVRLPRSAFLDQAHIRTICTRVQFAADACPAGAKYGEITAFTPLLDEPLQGPVYLRSSDHKLPDLVFDLHGIVDVEVIARIDSVKGGIRASIESSPDAPITKVLLRMQSQSKGLIVNSRDICKGANRADVQMDGQNGKVHDVGPKLRARCGKKGRGAKSHGGGRR